MFQSSTVTINELLLDNENPRFTTRDNKNFTQEEILNYLVDYEELIFLAKSINNYGGFTPGERIIAFKDKNNKYTVLEGNRRTASLKLLYNPNLISNKKTVPKITKECASFINNIPIDVVSTRSDADRALLSRHIDGIKKWSTFSKMKFYKKMYDNGRTLNELSSMSLESTNSIKKTLNQYSIFVNIIENYSTYFPNSTYLSNTNETKLQTDVILNRFFTYYRNTLGIIFSHNHELLLPNDKIEKNLLMKILVSIAKMIWEDGIDTRKLNTQKDIKEFLAGNSILNDTHSEILLLIESYINHTSLVNTQQINSSTNTSNQVHNFQTQDYEQTPIQNQLQNHIQTPRDNQLHNHIQTTHDNQLQNDIQTTHDNQLQNDIQTTHDNQLQNDFQTTHDNQSNIQIQTLDGNEKNDVRSTGRPIKNLHEYDKLTRAVPLKNKFRKNQRINSTIQELSNLEYKYFGLSANYLIRSLLETYAYEYTRIFNGLEPSNPNKLRGLTLKSLPEKDLQSKYYDHIAEHIGKIEDEKYKSIQIQIITFFNKSNNNLAITQKLNYYVHSPDFKPTQSENLDNWFTVSTIISAMDELLYQYAGQN